MTRYDREFRRIARTLSRATLMQSSEDFALDEATILDKDAGRRFLDFYGGEGLRLALDRYGFFAALARRGYPDVRLRTRADGERHTLLLEGRRDPADEYVRVLELVVRRDQLVPTPTEGLPPLLPSYDVLTIDWLLLESPHASFDREHPRLPGQRHPGLGIAWRVLALLYRAVDRLELGGLVTVADHLHNAEHYARELPFLDPAYKGRLDALLALLRDQHHLTVAEASWAMEWGLVKDEAGVPVSWRGELMVGSEAPSFITYFSSPAYAELARVAKDACAGFTLDEAAFRARWAEELAGGGGA